MIRDWEIIRTILVRLESAQTPNTVIKANDFPGIPEQEVAYNMRLLKDAGFIGANILESSDGNGLIHAALARNLTNAGHDLLDTIRNDSVWIKIKDKFVSNGVDMTFDLVMSVGKKIVESLLA